MSQAISHDAENGLERRSFIRGAIYTLTSLIGGASQPPHSAPICSAPLSLKRIRGRMRAISELQPGSPKKSRSSEAARIAGRFTTKRQVHGSS